MALVERRKGNVIALAVYRKEDVDVRIKRCLVAESAFV
jgi:hypothetical protein